ncbi:hypothetical protein [Sutcliffiella rhizosphaerae]|uniref:Glycosyltransferase RgtA/B/C/D-like domain-containing protein n=1 Tax=Sutcliffiella rhizosphaerae TaxID=2880967 RepID=A0ABM8YMB8_9BACI|nr:hypothetical protein [Sutcliffiella rhizosphaerae]CAG9621136.1 hypothetical protein BACCIP111883_01908 [Sutcliffiella rhizosphaerae]
MINSLFHFGALFLSFAGWGMLFYNKWRLNPAVIPLLVFSWVTAIVFGAGLLNIISIAVYLIFAMGILLTCYYIYLSWKKRVDLFPLLTPSTVIFLVSLIIIVFSFRGLIHTHYDDFSHWGLIVKEMFQVNGLPDGRTMVDFKNYPPGSAVFIFYILSIFGYAESYALMAQAFLISSALIVLFISIKWNNIGKLVLAIVIFLTLLTINGTYIYTLLVDGLLGFVALAITIIAFHYRHDWRKSVAVNAPILILLLLIKDSGKVFFLINICIILLFVIKNQLKDKTIKNLRLKAMSRVIIAVLVIPLSLNFLWGQYVDKVYQESNYNKFAINRAKLMDINKSEEFIQQLGPMLIESSTNLEVPSIKSFLILNCLVIATIIYMAILHQKRSKLLISSLIYVNAAYIFYIFTLYLMYLFLMPENEAVRLAGFGRYLSTISIYCVGILMAVLSYEWTTQGTVTKNKVAQGICILLLGISFFLPFKDSFKNLITNKPNSETSIRLGIKDQYQRLLNAQASGSHVLYYSPKSFDDRGYLDFILKYEQLNRQYSITRSVNTEEELNEFFIKLEAADYLVLVDEDQQSEQHLSGYMVEKSKNGVYVIVKDNDGKIITLKPVE